MKIYSKLISIILILSVIFSMVAIVNTSAVTYSSSKGSATVTCGKYKATYKASSYGSISNAINKALDVARVKGTKKVPATVKIAKGNYYLNHTIVVYSNTILDATGAAFKCKGNMLRLGYKNKASSAKGYGGAKNITIVGGTWDMGVSYSNANNSDPNVTHSTFRLAHSKKITIDGCVFKNNYNCHDIEMGGVKNVEIMNCTFSNAKNVNKYSVDGGREAVQIDINTSTAVPYLPSFDNTVSKKVSIHNNTFKNKFRGIGSHHAVLGKVYDGIKIYDNTFKNIAGVAVYGMYMNNVNIYNNTMKNVGSGILLGSVIDSPNFKNTFDYSYNQTHDTVKESNSYIYGNNIKVRVKNNNLVSSFGIRVLGSNYPTNNSTCVKRGAYYIYNVTVGADENDVVYPNVISGNVDSGINLRYAKNTKVVGNTITLDKSQKSYCYGIDVRSSKNIDIDNNIIINTTHSQGMGVFMSDFDKTGVYCDTINVTNNTINTSAETNTQNFGVRTLCDTTNVTLENNIISSGNECLTVNGSYDKINSKKYFTVKNNTMDTVQGLFHMTFRSINESKKIENNLTSNGEECTFVSR